MTELLERFQPRQKLEETSSKLWKQRKQSPQGRNKLDVFWEVKLGQYSWKILMEEESDSSWSQRRKR